MFSRLTRLSRAQKRAILLITDAGLILPAIWVAVLLRAEPGLDVAAFVPDIGPLMGLAIAMSLALGIADTRISAYEEHAAGQSLTLSCVLAFGVAAMGFAHGRPVAVGLAVLFGLFHFGASVLARVAMAKALGWAYARGATMRRVLIHGAGSFGLQALSALKAHPDLVPVGFVDDTPSLRGLKIGGLQVYPPVRLRELAARLGAHEVLIAQPTLTPPERAELGARLEADGLRVATLPALAQLSGLEPGARGVDLTSLERPLPDRSPGVAETFAGASVLITGAGGSIGSELARQVLRDRPAKLLLLELSEYALYQIDAALRPLAEQAGVPVISVLGSIADEALMARVLDYHGVDIVLHAAAFKHVPLVEANPIAALSNNVLGTECLARVAAKAGVSRFVLISTDKAVRPASIMGLSKWIAEQVVRGLGRRAPDMAVSVVRFGNVLGSSGSVLPLFQRQVRSGGPVTVTDPRMERYFMSVEEAVHLVLEAASIVPEDGVYFFDMGRPMRIEDLARRVIHAAGYTVADASRPDGDIPLRFTGARPGEKLTELLCASPNARTTGHPRIYFAPEAQLSELELARILRLVRQAVADGQVPEIEALLPEAGIAEPKVAMRD